MRKIEIESANCKRCNKLIATLNRPIYPGKTGIILKEKFGLICDSCLSNEEKLEVYSLQLERIKEISKELSKKDKKFLLDFS